MNIVNKIFCSDIAIVISEYLQPDNGIIKSQYKKVLEHIKEDYNNKHSADKAYHMFYNHSGYAGKWTCCYGEKCPWKNKILDY